MNKALRLIGLARKGGNAAVGEEAVASAVRLGRAKTVLLAADASDRTARRAKALAAEFETEIILLPFSKEELGGSVGRTSCAMLSVLNKGLSDAVKDSLRGGTGPK
jgi:ribosomal protein L7Ae-like RNA K-turn-binding protein